MNQEKSRWREQCIKSSCLQTSPSDFWTTKSNLNFQLRLQSKSSATWSNCTLMESNTTNPSRVTNTCIFKPKWKSFLMAVAHWKSWIKRLKHRKAKKALSKKKWKVLNRKKKYRPLKSSNNNKKCSIKSSKKPATLSPVSKPKISSKIPNKRKSKSTKSSTNNSKTKNDLSNKNLNKEKPEPPLPSQCPVLNSLKRPPEKVSLTPKTTIRKMVQLQTEGPSGSQLK